MHNKALHNDVGVFRLQYHGFHFSGQYKSLDRVFEREIEKSSDSFQSLIYTKLAGLCR